MISIASCYNKPHFPDIFSFIIISSLKTHAIHSFFLMREGACWYYISCTLQSTRRVYRGILWSSLTYIMVKERTKSHASHQMEYCPNPKWPASPRLSTRQEESKEKPMHLITQYKNKPFAWISLLIGLLLASTDI